MKANSEKTKQSKKATRRVLTSVLCGASVLSLVLSLVMPPISQAIANDAQPVSTEKTVMGGSSSESTDVDDTTNGDTENQNSDDAEGDETGDDAQPEGQSEDALQAEDNIAPAAETVAAVAENGQTESAAEEITNADELRDKLQGVQVGQTASFKLTGNIDYDGEIFLSNNKSNITLDLNGCKIKHSGDNTKPLFSVSGGAEFTITDSNPDDKVTGTQQLQNQGQDLVRENVRENYGKNGKVDPDEDGIPTKLTYYVTKSSASGTDTTELLETHEVNIKGAIVSTASTGSTLKLINVYNHGKFNLRGGTLTQKKGCNVGSLIYAENGSTVNMSGGYVCGATSKSYGAGIELGVKENNGAALKLTGGVIAGNCAPSGGGVYANGAAVTVTGGVISGNSTLDVGLGGGIMAEGGIVTVSGGYITNNKMAKFCKTEGSGCHGGGGLAANNGAHVTISGGQITGNYSEEAGGGVYVSDAGRQGWSRKDTAWLNITGGTIASNVSFRSEGAGIRVGQMVDAMIGDTPDNNDTPGSKVYITNNRCMSRFDWGGGGIFVQGDSNTASNAGRLFVYNSYISSNTAGGYGGGVAVCPTGKTLVTNTKGTAIFGNSSAGAEHDWKNDYNTEDNSGNDRTPHLSGGGIGDTDKTEDRDAYNKEVFRKYGHADFFLAARDHNTPVAVVSGKMLGNIDAKYSGSIELTNRITIPANGAVGVKNSIGLTSDVKATDQAVTDAVQGKVQGTKVTTFITGNYSWDHGGGIMSNGDLYLGQPADAHVYPSLKLKATKALSGRDLKDREFTFTVYRKGSDDVEAPSWKNNVFDNGGCEFVKSAPNNADGNIAFDLSDNLGKQLSDHRDQFQASGTGETTNYDITYYLVENAGEEPGVKFDHAVYEIKVTVKCNKTVLMSVPIQGKPNESRDLIVYNYTIDRVDVTKNPGGSANSQDHVRLDDDGYYSIADSGGGSTFTNKYTPSVSWTPEATKVVEGGEMKEFTLQLAKDSKFKDIIGTAVTSGNENKQTHSFLDGNGKEIELTYSLSDIRNSSDPGDSTGGPSKTFKYYVREKNERSTYPHYEFDQSVYELTVVAKDDDAGITTNVTYTQIVDAEGNEIPENERESKPYGEDTNAGQSLPTFTNTYSTSLPLSGMSGVTLTYLAGAAVLCAAAAWMHIRRKANAKGGERRE